MKLETVLLVETLMTINIQKHLSAAKYVSILEQ